MGNQNATKNARRGGQNGPLGRSWAVWGSLWESLGALLGWSWGDFSNIWSLDRFFSIFGSVWGAKRVPKGTPLGSQNGQKIDPKSRAKIKSEKIASWAQLGSILPRLGSGLELKNVCFSLRFKAFRENRRFRRR